MIQAVQHKYGGVTYQNTARERNVGRMILEESCWVLGNKSNNNMSGFKGKKCNEGVRC